MIELLKKEIEKAERVVLLGHRNPDGDCIGATLAMSHILKQLNKKATVILPNDIPAYLKWLEGADDILTFSNQPEQVAETLKEADFLFVLDFNAFSRLGEMEDLIPSVPCVMIDHHPEPEIDTPLLFSDTSVSSTCEFLTDILYQLDYDQWIEPQCATALFVGILTDTGRFNHNSSRPQTYRMVANLLEKGVNKDEVMDLLFATSTESRMRLTGFALSEKMEIFPEHGLSIMSLSLEEKKRFDFKQGDAEGLVNMPLSISGITRSIFMQEYDDGIRMSFRSKGDIAVNTLAAEHFGGGGHRNAAGGSSNDSLEHTLIKVKEICGVK